MEELIVRKNTARQILLICTAIFLVALSFVTVFANIKIFDSTLLAKAVGIFGICFFSFGSWILITRFKNSSVIFKADNTGITDNTSYVSVGFIPWEDVVSIRLREIGFKKNICIKVCNSEKYIYSLSAVKRRIVSWNLKMGYEVVNITLQEADPKEKEVMQILLNYFERYKAANRSKFMYDEIY